jgi:O-antigen/teichoic acid export membrane protein
MRYPTDLKLLIYLASLGMIFSAGTLFYNIFQAKLLMAQFSIITLVMKIFLVVFTIVLILLKANLFYFILISLLITIIQIIFIYYYSRRFLQVKIAMDFKIWKELLKNSWPLVISAVFISIFTRIDQVMLFSMKGKEDLGLYAAVVKLAELPCMILGVFLTSLFPLLSKYAKTSPDSFKKIYEITFKYPMMFIMPVAVMTTLYSKQIVVACYGQSFFASWPAMAILIWSTVFVYLAAMHALLLIATDLQNLDIIFTASYAILNILLNLILIPKYSFIGAAIATTISCSVIIPLSYSLGKTRRFAKVMIKSTIKPLFAALLSGYVVYLLSFLHFVFNLIIGGFIYLFLILLIKGVDSQDIRYGREIFGQIFKRATGSNFLRAQNKVP